MNGNGAFPNFRWELKISLGQVLTILTLIVTLGYTYGTYANTVSANVAHISDLTVQLRANLADHETLVRREEFNLLLIRLNEIQQDIRDLRNK